MRRLIAACGVLALVACSGGGTADGGDAAPAELSLPTVADFAGNWQLVSTLDGVADPVESRMTGTGVGTDWLVFLEDRDPVPLEVSIVGDSLVGQTTSYESILRTGVMVSIRTAAVLQDGALVGNVTAIYTTDEGDEVVRGTFRGTRVEN